MWMEFRLAQKEEVEEIVKISKVAFDTDVCVGAIDAGGPPDYDSVKWHLDMQENGNLYVAINEGVLIGGALLFYDGKDKGILYVGRIFISPKYHKKGFGIQLMEMIEKMSPDLKVLRLDTPVWNVRTNTFYPKCGFKETSRDEESIYYEKKLVSL